LLLFKIYYAENFTFFYQAIKLISKKAMAYDVFIRFGTAEVMLQK